MNARFLFFLLIIFCFSSAAVAAENDVDANDVNNAKSSTESLVANYAIGLNLGNAVGNGFVARLYSEKSFTQMTYAGFIDKLDDTKYFNVSLSFARYLKVIKPSRYASPVGLKWVVGAGAVYDDIRGRSSNKINAGSGFGIDFGAAGKPGFIFSLNAIYTMGFSGLRAPSFMSLNFEPTVGALYNFN